MSDKVEVFDTLPVGRRVRETPVDWEAAKQKCLDNPEKWVLMAENVTNSIPGQLKRGRNRSFQGKELELFEFSVVKPEKPPVPYGPRRTDLYGRYTPPGKTRGSRQARPVAADA